MYVVSHIGGTCGDLITAVIDSTDTHINWTAAVKLPMNRVTLKQGKLKTDNEVSQYLLDIFKKYKSVSSHSPIPIENIKLINPVIYDKKIAIWAAHRFTRVNLKKPYNDYMCRECKNDEEYANILLDHCQFVTEMNTNPDTILIDVRDIVEGNLIKKLQNYIDTELDNNFYQRWLSYGINRM